MLTSFRALGPTDAAGTDVDYIGVLDEAHLHAVIRAALRARGFDADATAAANLAADRWALGSRAIDEMFRDGPGFFDPRDLDRLRVADPRLAARLPFTAALGWLHVEALLPFADAATDGERRRAAALGAAFNSAISVLDYIVDERTDGARVFSLLNGDVIRAIFEASVDVDVAFAAAYRGLDDPRVRVLIALVAICAHDGRALVAATRNTDAWAELGRLVVRMRDAQQDASLASSATAGRDEERLAEALEHKSALPSVAMLYIAQMAGRGMPAPDVRAAARALGHILWRIDDACDLLLDCRRGTTSALVQRLGRIVRADKRQLAADADVYRAVNQAADDIVRCLDRCGPLTELGRACIADWVSWQVDAPACHRPRQIGSESTRMAAAALDALLDAQRNGFSEAAHRLRFPRLDLRHETHGALLSFRAVALDALLDARDAGLPVPERVLNGEALEILQSKHVLVRGGWNYVAAVPELPPDADDNGQVLQVLARLGGRALAATCDEPIRMLLDASGPDGGVPTWAIDPRGDTPADAAVRAYLPIMGGWGVHPEVVANFAYGLLLYDRARFFGPLQRIAAYLEAVQTAAGSWTSAWYDGPYYGTFRATAVLGQIAPSSPSLARAREFVRARQRSDGGWGKDASEPLSTALALLALDELGAGHDRGCAHALEYLRSTQRLNGRWPAVPWIRFPTVDGEVVYGSETMTTAFCLKALVAS